MKSKTKVGVDRAWEETKLMEIFFFFIFSLRSFSDLWKSDRRRSSEQKAKLVYATRATHRYQYLSLLSNFKM